MRSNSRLLPHACYLSIAMPSQPSRLHKQVGHGLAWVGMASTIVSLLDIVAHLIILGPLGFDISTYGVAALVMAFFPVLDKATDLGLSASVIQKDDHSIEKISTIFWLNLLMSVLMFLLLAFVIGPIVSHVQGAAIVTSLLTVYGLKLIFQNMSTIPTALMARDFRFREISLIRLVANSCEFVVKVGTAAAGFGIWCFVVAPLARVIVLGIGTQIVFPWIPKFVFHFRAAYQWITFGIKTSASQILFHLYTNVDYHIVSFYFGSKASGFYFLAYTIVLTPSLVIGGMIHSVAFPAFSRLKNNIKELTNQYIELTKINVVILGALLGAIFVTATDLTGTLTNYQTEMATSLQILCFVGIFRSLSFVIPPLLDGMGKASHTLAYMIVASIAVPTSLMLCAKWLHHLGEISVAIGWALGYPIAFFVLAWMALRQLQKKPWDILRPLLGTAACIGISMTLGYAIRFALAAAPQPLRFACVTITVIVSLFVLLARYQGIDIRAIRQALRSQ